MEIAFITLGCPKNQLDSEIMQGLLQGGGHVLVESIDEAEALIINTCSFIKEAKEEAIDTILEYIHFKKEGYIKFLLVTGCLVQAHYHELKEELLEVDAFLGLGEFHQIVKVLETLQRGEKWQEVFRKGLFDYNKPWPRSPFLRDQGSSYLRIAEGCNYHCSYCIIPFLRGPYRSRSQESILAEAQGLVKEGVKELILVAQDTGAYGVDVYLERRLPELLKALAALEGLHWIRILYLNPKGVTPKLLEVFKEEEKILPYLDLPLQHSSPSILKAMNRGGSGEEMREMLYWIKETLPEVTLRSTMMVGFPGEGEEDFQHLYSFVEEMAFHRLGVFCYSKEEGTPSSLLPNQVPPDVKEERRKELMQLQQGISLAKNKGLVGEELEVLSQQIDTLHPPLLIGRSRHDAPDIDNLVYFSVKEPLLGQFYQVRITHGLEYDLMGEEIP